MSNALTQNTLLYGDNLVRRLATILTTLTFAAHSKLGVSMLPGPPVLTPCAQALLQFAHATAG